MNRGGSIIITALAIGAVAVILGVGAGFLSERFTEVSSSPLLELNPACRTSEDCLALECGGRTFVVANVVSFDAVREIHGAWCEGNPISGLQRNVRCSEYGRCILSTAPEEPAVPAAGIADLEIVAIHAYPNIASVLIDWRTTVPANARVVFTGGELEGRAFQSESGLSVVHRVSLSGLSSNTEYPYRIEASAQRGAVVTHDGKFRTLPAPGGAVTRP